MNILSIIINNRPKLERIQNASIGKWINKIPYIHKMEYYCTIKIKLVTYAITLMSPKYIMPNDKCQMGKTVYYMITYI